ncbi:M15 family metallopeptidase [Chromobacterium violaceum]|uniref:M15 family metallopeptidase n=1 Tax=Chromobacterium violaceum TaxID=536 RepID=UPI001B32DD17|nr:M15 family metallopeptidase [Chromobacterium violaceum]MBP4043810.1 M15 family metallopeptidase [Chromobacterium violaceum]
MSCFGKRSEELLVGVHADLVMVARRAKAIASLDFIVIEWVRSIIRQKELVGQGASRTMNSRHLTGHAIDLAPWMDGAIPWKNWPAFEEVGLAMKKAASELNIPIVWGGDWKNFRDGPHFELPREYYP